MAYTECNCQWCGKFSLHCVETQDPDEGIAGPVYLVCRTCRLSASKEAAKELEEMYPYGIPGE